MNDDEMKQALELIATDAPRGERVMSEVHRRIGRRRSLTVVGALAATAIVVAAVFVSTSVFRGQGGRPTTTIHAAAVSIPEATLPASNSTASYSTANNSASSSATSADSTTPTLSIAESAAKFATAPSFVPPSQPVMATTRGPESSFMHMQTGNPPSTTPPHQVITDIALLPTFWLGNAKFTPYEGVSSAVVSSDVAFKKAVLAVPLEAVTGPGRLAVVDYTNSAYGEIQKDGSVKLGYVDVPVWVLVYPIDGSIDMSLGGPNGRGAPARPAQTGCVWFSLIDARTGEFITSGGQCAP